MSNKHLFNTIKNIELLWEVLLDDSYIKGLNEVDKINVYEIFNSHRKIFYEKEKDINNNANLIELNKRFLSFFIQILNTKKQENIYKIEDIHNQRQSKFQKDLAEKKMDFENMTMKLKPPELDFTEKIEETKIKGMEELISKTIEQRNYEISMIHNSNYNTLPNINSNTNSNTISNSNSNSNSNTNSNSNSNSNTNPNIKYIKIKEEIPIKHDVINLKGDNEKKISWSNENEIKYFNKNDILLDDSNSNINESNIFKKLKKIPSNPVTNPVIDELVKKIDMFEERMQNIEMKLDELIKK
jgi:hypothetical protein